MWCERAKRKRESDAPSRSFSELLSVHPRVSGSSPARNPASRQRFARESEGSGEAGRTLGERLEVGELLAELDVRAADVERRIDEGDTRAGVVE